MITFRELDENCDRPSPPASLDDWYDSLRDHPFSKFSSENLARACRQRLYLSIIVPYALNRLIAGLVQVDEYDEELLQSLIKLPLGFWQKNNELFSSLVEIAPKTLKALLKGEVIDEEDFEDVSNQLDTLSSKMG